MWISYSAPSYPPSFPSSPRSWFSPSEPPPFVHIPCMVQALSLPLFFPQPCLHEGFESSFTVRSHESCANCTSASVGRDTHLWSPMLCKSASRPSKPLDAASCCDPPLHSVMCQDGFPTMHSLVQCQGKKKKKRQIICCHWRQTCYLWGRQWCEPPPARPHPPSQVGLGWAWWTLPVQSGLQPSKLLVKHVLLFYRQWEFGKVIKKKTISCFYSLSWIHMAFLFIHIVRPALCKYN